MAVAATASNVSNSAAAITSPRAGTCPNTALGDDPDATTEITSSYTSLGANARSIVANRASERVAGTKIAGCKIRVVAASSHVILRARGAVNGYTIAGTSHWNTTVVRGVTDTRTTYVSNGEAAAVDGIGIESGLAFRIDNLGAAAGDRMRRSRVGREEG